MTKQSNKKSKGAKPSKAKAKPFVEQVYDKLSTKWQGSGDLAVKLKLVDDNGEPSNYGRTKVRDALKELIANKRAEQQSAFRFAKYRRAA